VLRAGAAISKANGEWQLLKCSGWPDNQSCENLLAWSWTSPEERFLVAINFSETPSQGKVALPWSDLTGSDWKLRDLMTSDMFERAGSDMAAQGLFVDLQPWHSHVLSFERSASFDRS
jgi:hypothetical protein